jgi:hypothetical protein
MTARKNILASVALLAVVGGVAWQIFRSRVPDPIYEGKHLSYWLERCDIQPFDAKAAVRDAGTNAIPLLLHYMQVKDFALKRKMIALANKHDLEFPFASADYWRYRALFGFIALGADGKSAVPELMRIYEVSIPLDSGFRVLGILDFMGPEAKEAIPLLLRVATNSNLAYRENAVHALGQMHVRPEVVVPALMNCLKDSNPYVRQQAVRSLGEVGPSAKAAVPGLRELRQSVVHKPDLSMRETIDKALQKIDPIAATNAGIAVTNASPAQ